MKYYIELTLLPNEEVPLHFLWEKLYQKIHLVLVNNKIGDEQAKDGSQQVSEYSKYGLSFPHYDEGQRSLGAKLRVFAQTHEKLKVLDMQKQLNSMSDYCSCTDIIEVPERTLHVRFERKQVKRNIERRARRKMLKTGETLEQVVSMLQAKGFTDKKTDLPFVYMESSSTSKKLPERHRFRLFIEKIMVDDPKHGYFNTYGLSKTATVPWF